MDTERKPSPEPTTHKIAYSRREAAAQLSMSVETLDRLTKRNLLRPSRATRSPLYSHKELERFMAETEAIV